MPGNAFGRFDGDLVTLAARDPHSDDVTCFEDEVVVDFPSVAPAVDRIRAAFLADEGPSVHETAIHLSLREAYEGVTVPLSVQVRRTCAECSGRGGSWTDSCRRCAGAGCEVVPHQLQVTVPPGVSDGTRVQLTVTAPYQQTTRIELRIAVA